MRGRRLANGLAVLACAAAGGFLTAGSADAASPDDDFRADIFRLMNTATDQCADLPVKAPTSDAVVQEPCTQRPTQVWLAQPSPTTFDFQLVNQSSGLCMDLDRAANDGTHVVQATCSPKLPSQRWQFLFGPVVGPVRVVHQATGQCLEVEDGSLAEGAPLQVSPCDSSVPHQVWHKIDILRPTR